MRISARTPWKKVVKMINSTLGKASSPTILSFPRWRVSNACAMPKIIRIKTFENRLPT
jgi:hypothetical protein